MAQTSPAFKALSLTRRDALRAAVGVAVLASCKAATDAKAAVAASRLPEVPNPTLRDVCRAIGVLHGAARDHVVEPEDPTLDRLMARECDVVTPENGGKWAVFQPQEGNFDWRRFDASVALARRIGAKPNWHCALWQHIGMPEYMKLPAARQSELGIAEEGYFSPEGTLSPDNYWRRFTGMVAAVKARYGDVFHRIDVVNEAFFWETERSHPQEQDRHGFRKGMWWVVAGGAKGPEWLDPFFHHMRKQFPSAKLVLNEFGIEIDEGWQQRKRAYLQTWLTDAVARGVPVDGLGLQSHLMAGKPYDREGLRQFLKAMDRLGLPIHITEFDVDEQHLPRRWSRAEKDRAMAFLAGQYVADIMNHAKLAELCWWSLRSDLSYIARENPGLNAHPAPYDAGGRPLPLYEAAVQALRGLNREG
ncbi:endo-1,4-beta-xylanase [Azospirillum sp. sgz302134]